MLSLMPKSAQFSAHVCDIRVIFKEQEVNFPPCRTPALSGGFVRLGPSSGTASRPYDGWFDQVPQLCFLPEGTRV